VDDYVDDLTKRTVYSIYGKNRAPTKEQLDLVDAIIFDIQDVGARFYTFVWSMTYAMEACAQYNKTFVVIDRPNPIGADMVEGPPNAINANMIGRKWPDAKWGVPTRHGMTVGEIALLVDREWMDPKLGDLLHVVKIPDYKRSLNWEQLGRPWVMPSPNMPTFDGTAIVYPGTGIFENVGGVSEGRGTTRPFEILGAPSANATTSELITRTLNEKNLPGCHFRTTFFTPTFGNYIDKLCGGLQIHVTDRKAFRPIRTSLEILKTYLTILPDSVTVSSNTNYESGIVDLDKNIFTMTPEQIEALWQSNLTEFMDMRKKYLLYD